MDFEYETPQNDVNQTIILEETTSQSSTSHEETDKTAPKKNRTGLIILLVLCCISLVGGIINWVQQKKAPSQEVLKITSSMPFTSSTKERGVLAYLSPSGEIPNGIFDGRRGVRRIFARIQGLRLHRKNGSGRVRRCANLSAAEDGDLS